MNFPAEKALNSLTDNHRGWGRIILPLLVTLATLLGAKVIWPKESIEVLQAQQSHLGMRIDSVKLTIAEQKIAAADQALALTTQIEGMQRQLNTLTILSCFREKRGTLAFRLANCDTVLARF